MTCPFCGWSESSVARSRALHATDAIRRRRRCAQCGKDFPTSERVDRERLEAELAGDAAMTAQVFQQRAITWDEAHRQLHLVWGNAKDGHYVKADLVALQATFYDLERENSRLIERVAELERSRPPA